MTRTRAEAERLCWIIGHIWQTIRTVSHEVRGDERYSRIRKDREFVTHTRECKTCRLKIEVES